MKFSQIFRLPHLRFFSVVFGLLTGLPLLLFTPWQVAVVTGASVTLVASLVLPLMVYREEKAYQRIKNTISDPHLLDERVRFTVRDGSIGGYMILTPQKLILLSLDKGQHRLELDREQIKRIIASDENRSLTIFISNTQFVRVFFATFERTCQVLNENGWNVAE